MFRLNSIRPMATRAKANIALLLAGFGAILFYLTCSNSCAGIGGSLFGIDLVYVGLLFLAAVGGSLLLGRSTLTSWMLATGAGSEIYLIGYQVRTGEYCPFCLLFAAVVLAMTAVNFSRAWLRPMLLGMPAGLGMLLVFFSATPPAFHDETAAARALPVYGEGPKEIRLYTDFFCGPCSRIEPELEKKLLTLVEDGKARVIFVEVPLHRHSSLYAAYFQAMRRADGDIRQAIEDRNLLFAAARQKLETPESLEKFLKKAGRVVVLDRKRIDFTSHNQLLVEDRISSTPTLVIRDQKTREILRGCDKVLEGIDKLMQLNGGTQEA
jgi:protein-disulfide isomerase